MALWREWKIPIILSAHLLKDYIISSTITLDGRIADKIEYHIERIHEDNKRFERVYQCVTDFTQSKTSQMRLQDKLSNSIIEK